MGVWGTDPFENDDALDLVEEIVDAPREAAGVDAEARTDIIVANLRMAADEDDGDEAPAAAIGVAAAEIVAAVRGHPYPGMDTVDERLSEWIASVRASPLGNERSFADDTVRDEALKAVGRARRSELADLWTDAQVAHADAWLTGLDDLENRLRIAPAPPLPER